MTERRPLVEKWHGLWTVLHEPVAHAADVLAEQHGWELDVAHAALQAFSPGAL